MSRECGTRI